MLCLISQYENEILLVKKSMDGYAYEILLGLGLGLGFFFTCSLLLLYIIHISKIHFGEIEGRRIIKYYASEMVKKMEPQFNVGKFKLQFMMFN